MLGAGLWTLDFSPSALQRVSDDLSDSGNLVNAHERIHLGKELGEFLAKTLRQAAGNDNPLATVLSLAQLGGFQDGIDAFLLRGIDEGAGIDDDHIRLRGVVGNFGAIFQQRAEHDLGVHQVLCAA